MNEVKTPFFSIEEPTPRAGDFIQDIKNEILTRQKNTLPNWAESCATASLIPFLGKVRVIEEENPLKTNLYLLMIGISGIGKTKPMFNFTRKIVFSASGLIGKDLLYPNRQSVEGFVQYLSEKDKDGKYYIHDKGIILRDEFSGLFRQAVRADWQSDALEFLSELYDGNVQKRSTVSHGVNEVPEVYCSLISATTYEFLNEKRFPVFHRQGSGNRTLYEHYNLEEYKVEQNGYS